MSRCFPYPPPGYAVGSAGKEALIGSIKLQKEKLKAEEQRKKEKKREEKEKRKEKKQKNDKNLAKADFVQGDIGGKFWIDSRVDLFHKGSKVESEQLEKSSLTEEHGKPVSLRAPSSSSNSTGNSNKRKKQSLPLDVSRSHGNIIRIRLSSKKHKQSDASANEQQPCSTSGRTPFTCQTKDDISLTHRSEGCISELASSNDREQICSTSKQTDTVSAGKTRISSATAAVLTPMQKEELLYKNLIENWVPTHLQNPCRDTEDQDWLFASKNEGVRSEKKRICRDNGPPCSSTSALWPRAQYLPEVDVYALPFAVPF